LSLPRPSGILTVGLGVEEAAELSGSDRTLGRRDFVKQAAGWAGLSAIGMASRCSGGNEGVPDPPVIDVHIHTNFEDETARRQAQTLSRVDYSAAGLLAEMAESNVERAIAIGFETQGGELSQKAENPFPPTIPADPRLAAKLLPIGGINPNRLDSAGLAGIEEQLAAGRVKGLKIYLGYYPVPPGADAYKPVYELAAKYATPVIFHTGDTYSADAKVRYAHPLPIDDVAVDYRGVTFVLAHLGNPWTLDAAEVVYKNPNVYADLSGFLVGDAAYFEDPDSAKGIDDAVERIREAFAWVENPQKFLYGSDWPLVPMKPYLSFVRRAIDPEHHEEVFYANAKRVFQIE
jgi:predicted TIM-barrel fold metal-dependent hydrolase